MPINIEKSGVHDDDGGAHSITKTHGLDRAKK
jgi:hypothetical protein